MIDTKGLNRAAVLAALFNASRPLGMGFMQYDKTPMTPERAQEIIDTLSANGATRIHFDYLQGRVMKLDLSNPDGFEPHGYNRDVGPGAAEKVIEELRRTFSVNTAAIQETHKSGLAEAADEARKGMLKDHSWDNSAGMPTLNMGLKDVAHVLDEKVNEAVK
jgi:hypothetical protein